MPFFAWIDALILAAAAAAAAAGLFSGLFAEAGGLRRGERERDRRSNLEARCDSAGAWSKRERLRGSSDILTPLIRKNECGGCDVVYSRNDLQKVRQMQVHVQEAEP